MIRSNSDAHLWTHQIRRVEVTFNSEDGEMQQVEDLIKHGTPVIETKYSTEDGYYWNFLENVYLYDNNRSSTKSMYFRFISSGVYITNDVCKYFFYENESEKNERLISESYPLLATLREKISPFFSHDGRLLEDEEEDFITDVMRQSIRLMIEYSFHSNEEEIGELITWQTRDLCGGYSAEDGSYWTFSESVYFYFNERKATENGEIPKNMYFRFFNYGIYITIDSCKYFYYYENGRNEDGKEDGRKERRIWYNRGPLLMSLRAVVNPYLSSNDAEISDEDDIIDAMRRSIKLMFAHRGDGENLDCFFEIYTSFLQNYEEEREEADRKKRTRAPLSPRRSRRD